MISRHLSISAYLVDEGLSKGEVIDHEVIGEAQIEARGDVRIKACQHGVGAGDGRQDCDQQFHGDQREKTASRRLFLELNL